MSENIIDRKGVKLYRLPRESFNNLPTIAFNANSENIETRRQNLEAGSEICIVADYEGKIIGEINIMLISLKNDNVAAAVIPNKRAYFYGLGVHSDLRGFGLGTNLLTEAISLCNMLGYIEQTIAVKRNCPAAKLYEKVGFRAFLNDLSFDGEIFDLMLRVGDLDVNHN